jgi:signal transduction histidine kinase
MKATCPARTFEKFSTNRLFDGIENSILKEIRPQLGVLRVRKDEVIYREGDRGQYLYLVGEGLVRISQRNQVGLPETLDYIKSGNFFGGRAMLEKKPYAAMAIADQPSLLGTVKAKAFEKMLTIAPARLHMNFLRAVSERLRTINSRFMSDVLQAERLRVVEAMASSILHDLKNPVSIARCCSDLIAAETGSSELQSLTALLGSAVSGMVATTQELLDYTRGSISLKKQRVSVRRILEELNQQSLRLLPAKNIELVKHIRYDGNIDVDLARFVRVLGHLVQNACDAMPNGGVLRFTTDLVQNDVALRITDSGHGIHPELLSKLFQPFSTNVQSAGTGLSLAIAKAVVEAHGGRISIASVPDKGTTVDIRLPQPVED